MNAFLILLPILIVIMANVCGRRPRPYTAKQYEKWKRLKAEDQARYEAWRDLFPRDAFVNECSYVFWWRDGRQEDIDAHMLSLGHPRPQKTAPAFAWDV